jgi:hypothetical protein
VVEVVLEGECNLPTFQRIDAEPEQHEKPLSLVCRFIYLGVAGGWKRCTTT